MHNAIKINRIIEAAHLEINTAAQKIFDKYNNELIEAIKNQLYPNEILFSGMGSAVIEKAGENINDDIEMVSLIQSLLYPLELESGFDIQSEIKSNKYVGSRTTTNK